MKKFIAEIRDWWKKEGIPLWVVGMIVGGYFVGHNAAITESRRWDPDCPSCAIRAEEDAIRAASAARMQKFVQENRPGA